MIKIVYEKMEDYRRAIKELKIKRIFYNTEINLISKEQNAYAASFRITAISPDNSVHFTLLERICDQAITSETDKAAFEAKITDYKNKFFDLCRETMPDVIAVAGVIIP